MNKITIIAITAAAFTLPIKASETNEVQAIIAETMAYIHAEGWTAQDVSDAIKSLRGLYLRDCATPEGRKRWHGDIVSKTVDTNTWTQTTVYESGEVFVDAAKLTTPKAATTAANAIIKAKTNGVPAKLAAARLRRQAEASVISNVTVTVGNH